MLFISHNCSVNKKFDGFPVPKCKTWFIHFALHTFLFARYSVLVNMGREVSLYSLTFNIGPESSLHSFPYFSSNCFPKHRIQECTTVLLILLL